MLTKILNKHDVKNDMYINRIFPKIKTGNNNKHNLKHQNSINYNQYINYMRQLKKNKSPNKYDNYNHIY
jgi:poly-D-alanine transfer protein DltD